MVKNRVFLAGGIAASLLLGVSAGQAAENSFCNKKCDARYDVCLVGTKGISSLQLTCKQQRNRCLKMCEKEMKYLYEESGDGE